MNKLQETKLRNVIRAEIKRVLMEGTDTDWEEVISLADDSFEGFDFQNLKVLYDKYEKELYHLNTTTTAKSNGVPLKHVITELVINIPHTITGLQSDLNLFKKLLKIIK